MQMLISEIQKSQMPEGDRQDARALFRECREGSCEGQGLTIKAQQNFAVATWTRENNGTIREEETGGGGRER